MITRTLGLFGKAFTRMPPSSEASIEFSGNASLSVEISSPPTVDPLTLFSPDLLLDADNPSLFVLDGSSNISRWKNSNTGNTNADFVQSNASLRPTPASDSFGKSYVDFPAGKSLSSVAGLVDFGTGFGYTGPAFIISAFRGVVPALYDTISVISDLARLSKSGVGFYQAGPANLGWAQKIIFSSAGTGSVFGYRDQPTWLEDGATVECITYLNRHADGSAAIGILLWCPKSAKKNFFYFFEGQVESSVALALWGVCQIPYYNAAGMGVRELLYKLGAVSDADAALYARHLMNKYILSRVKNFVFFLGDSITYGNSLPESDSYPYKVMNTVSGGIDADYINAGISGRKVSEIVGDVASYTPLYRSYRKSVAVILEGINDSAAMSSVGGHASVLSSYWTCCDTLRNQGYRVVACTIIPAPSGSGGTRSTLVSERLAYNAGIVSGWADHADALVDLASLPEFNNWGTTDADPSASFNNTTYYLVDKVHPTAVGYDVISAAIGPAVSSLLI